MPISLLCVFYSFVTYHLVCDFNNIMYLHFVFWFLPFIDHPINCLFNYLLEDKFKVLLVEYVKNIKKQILLKL